jgi:hypothetical protein
MRPVAALAAGMVSTLGRSRLAIEHGEKATAGNVCPAVVIAVAPLPDMSMQRANRYPGLEGEKNELTANALNQLIQLVSKQRSTA